jgi:hypothetical protein
LNTINDKSYYLPKDQQTLKQLFEIKNDKTMSIDQIIKMVDENVIKSGLNSAAGNYVAYVPGHGIFSTVLADYLIDVKS